METEELSTKSKVRFFFLLKPEKLFLPALTVSFEMVCHRYFDYLFAFTSLISSAAFFLLKCHSFFIAGAHVLCNRKLWHCFFSTALTY